MDRGLDTLAILSVLLGLENLSDNRQQPTKQGLILQEINDKFDELMERVKILESHQKSC